MGIIRGYQVEGDERLRKGQNLRIVGEVIEECDECVLLAKHEVLQKNKNGEWVPTDIVSYLHPNFERPYAVIYLKDTGNSWLFFDDLDKAYEYYRHKKPLTGIDLDED